MKKIKFLFYILMLSLLVVSCEKSIDFNGLELERPYTIGFTDSEQDVDINTTDTIPVNWDGPHSSTDITVTYEVVNKVYFIKSNSLYTADASLIEGLVEPTNFITYTTDASAADYTLSDCIIKANTSEGVIQVTVNGTLAADALVCLVLRSASNNATLRYNRDVLLLNLEN